VSGQSFAEYCRLRIFEPLGMTHTSWRDDFRRIVRGRAIAYEAVKNGYEQDMPFENVYGNGGLLTTVGDLLKWNENAVDQKVGDAEFLRVEVAPGRFSNGKPHNYAMGLFIGTFAGLPEVYHSGSTAGYRAFLTRFPKQHLSVAVLCNASNGTAERDAHTVAEMYLADAVNAPHGMMDLGHDDILVPSLSSFVGLYRNTVTGVPLSLVTGKAELLIEGASNPSNIVLFQHDSAFQSFDGTRTFHFDGKGGLHIANANGMSETYQRVDPWKPVAGQLNAFAGRYTSDEAETELKVVASGPDLKITRRPDTTLTLRPVYKDAFQAEGLGLVRFRRDTSGRVIGFSVTMDRVWDLRFDRKQ
jgi:hypothetical protein